MEPVVGIFSSKDAARRGRGALIEGGFSADRIHLLLPGEGAELETAPTEEAEQSGVGHAVAGVVGGAAGASAGFGIGAVTASLLIPGVGAVAAVGLAAAALFGAAGAAGGVAAGKALEDSTRSGIPRDELYLYEDALKHGKTVLFAVPESEGEAERARRALAQTGAESLDAARDQWWVGIRDVEKTHYESSASDFESAEEVYRRGYLAGLRPDLEGVAFDEARPALEPQLGDVVLHGAFRSGYERGAARALRRRQELDHAPASSR
ncbi:MAG: hypothetical protein WEF99_07090 [Thermoanaerobaculia bacterium]